jgi:hypothetical protein
VQARTCCPNSFISDDTQTSSESPAASVPSLPPSPWSSVRAKASSNVVLFVPVCISTLAHTSSTGTPTSLLTLSTHEKVSPNWIDPNEAGNVRKGVARVRSRRVLGCPGKGSEPCKVSGCAVACADRDGEVEKKGCQCEAKEGRDTLITFKDSGWPTVSKPAMVASSRGQRGGDLEKTRSSIALLYRRTPNLNLCIWPMFNEEHLFIVISYAICACGIYPVRLIHNQCER